MTRLVISMLTFRRPNELELGLPLVVAHAHALGTGVTTRVLIVDNDPLGSARETVERIALSSAVPVAYVVEPEPGIAAARNRAMDEAMDAELLAFIDDDEHPTQSWLEPLLETWRQTRATAVMGRVESHFATALEPWVAAGEFFRRRSMPTGTEITVAAAGNLLLDLTQLRELGVRFDERLELGAGEDSLFSHEIVRRGGRIAWCEESVAIDRVPRERTSRAWVLARARSHGNAETVVKLQLAETARERAAVRATSTVRGAVRIVAGFLRYCWGLAARSLRHQARGLRTASRGLGIAAGAFGHVVREYAR